MRICNTCGIAFEKYTAANKAKCRKCTAKYQKSWRLANPEKYKATCTRKRTRAQEQKKYERKMADPVERAKVFARNTLYFAVRSGKLIRQSCEICGDTRVEGHHADYKKPREVRWLCRSHHNALHRGELL